MIAEMVREMVSKGVDIEVICLAVATAEEALLHSVRVTSADESVTERDEQAERRRYADRVRQQRRRDNLRTNRDNPQTVTVANIEDKNLKKDISRKKQIPPDWKPDEELQAWSLEKLGTVARLDSELEKFRCHHGAKGTLSKDWRLNWRYWVRQSLEYSPLVKPPPNLSIVGEKISLDEAVAQFAKLGRLSRYAPINDISDAPPELLKKHGLLPDGRRIA